MNILTPENKSINIDLLPNEIDEDIKYSILDLRHKNDYDFYFEPLVYLESFHAPVIVLDIEGTRINMPCLENPNDWKILIGDPEYGKLELVSLEDLNAREFYAFLFNPISSFRPSFKRISIAEIYPELTWFFPRMQNNILLTTPIESKNNPKCAFFVNSVSGRKVDSIDISSII